MTKHINIDRYDKCNHDWRSYGSMERLVVCDGCNSGTDVETLLLEQRQQLYDLMLEIIEADECFVEASNKPTEQLNRFGVYIKAQNELRQEQRQKLTNLFKGDKDA